MLNAKPLKTRQICLMFIAFLPVIKLFTLPGLMAQAAEQDMWLSALIALALDLITMFVILFTLRKEDTDFYGLLEDNFGRTGSLIILALFALCFFIKALLPVFEQQDFVTLTFYVTTPKSLMFLPFFLGAAYLAIKPLRVIGRCADVLFLFTAAGLIILAGFSFISFDAGALLPVCINGAEPVLRGAYTAAPWFGDCMYFLFVTGRFERKKKDGIKIFVSYTGAGLAAVLFMVIFYGTFSSIAFRQRFAINEISKYSAVINNLGRIDYLATFLLLFSGIVSLTLPLYFAGEILNRMTRIKNLKILPLAVCALCFAAVLLLDRNVYGLEKFITEYAVAFFILMANVLPVFICLIARKKGVLTKKHGEKTDELYQD